jgi:hypothetical protein
MRTCSLLAAAVLSLAGCQKEKVDASAPPPGRLGVPEVDDRDEGVASGPYVITPDLLDRYVRYQRKMIDTYTASLKELRSAPGKADASRVPPAVLARSRPDILAIIRKQSEAQATARQFAQLSERDVAETERVVSDVISRRFYAKNLKQDEAIKEMEEMKALLPAEHQREFDKSLQEMRRQREETTKLLDERKQYGDANVDLVLTREEELTKNWDEWLTLLSDGAPGAPRKKAAAARDAGTPAVDPNRKPLPTTIP